MTAQFARGSYPPRPVAVAHEPHAALLIDFDNVTMGIRSDLTKELKSLLNSDVIKGKVAVQRAYADWRRYPQYIVPLAEASVDLIFAPAYGSSKKNATDIRLAIDALELVFTRSEIGTFILLSGDSDFSSLVLKLKEYGKYVIGVGIRESASDLLVQNCDEYYSYSALTGLTRTSEETVNAGHDPWELVEIAVRQMVTDGDVMRSDRLKQVILDLDPNFDEKTLGFSKFNRFVQEAANRGLVRLHKMDNGQFELALPDPDAPLPAPRGQDEERGDGRRGRGRRSRGRREEREPRVREEGREPRVPEGAGAPAQRRQPAAAEPAAAAEAIAAVEPSAAVAPAGAAEPPERITDVEAEVRAEAHLPEGDAQLRSAYELLRRAAADVAREGGGVARDSDVKRRMLELRKDWDESVHGFSKFSRFLRQAHDDHIITVRRLENGNYEISLKAPSDIATEPAVRGRGAEMQERGGREPRGAREEEAGERPGRGHRDRRERGAPQPEAIAASPALQATVAPEPEADRTSGGGTPEKRERGESAASSAARAEEAPAARREAGLAGEAAAPAAATRVAAPAPSTAQGTGAATPVSTRGLGVGPRMGSRGRAGMAGPPPLLPGQAAPGARAAAAAPAAAAPGSRAAEQPAGAAAAEQPFAAAAAGPSAAAEMGASGSRRSRGRGKRGRETPVEAPTAAVPAEDTRPAGAPGRGPESRARGRTALKQTDRASPAGDRARDDAAARPDLPTDAEGVIAYLSSNFKGVGRRTGEQLVEAFGAARVFDALRDQPDRVKEVLGARRGESLLEAWLANSGHRAPAEAAAQENGEASRPRRSRGRRGGRKRSGSAASKE